MTQKRISAALLRQHLGADGRELAALRLLFGSGDSFPQADAALALQHLRRNRQPASAAARSGPLALLRKLRGANRRVPQEAHRDG